MNQTLPYQSVRFFPNWNSMDTDQVIGLIEMVNHILDNSCNTQHWIEIGSHYGESATIFLGFYQIAKLECVDISQQSISFLQDKLSRYIKSNRCLLHHSSSESYASTLSDKSVNVIYIDANHTYESVYQDLRLYYPKIMLGGYLCGHDYSAAWPGTMKAVNEFAESLGKDIKIFRDSSWLISTMHY